MVIHVNEQECSGCGLCVDSCPNQAIVLNELAVVDREKCTGCGSCVDECPNEALQLIELIANSTNRGALRARA